MNDNEVQYNQLLTSYHNFYNCTQSIYENHINI
jgi:hypothetical protein